jgi:hypothetical protein
VGVGTQKEQFGYACQARASSLVVAVRGLCDLRIERMALQAASFIVHDKLSGWLQIVVAGLCVGSVERFKQVP